MIRQSLFAATALTLFAVAPAYSGEPIISLNTIGVNALAASPLAKAFAGDIGQVVAIELPRR
jgi:hypothetical protein